MVTHAVADEPADRALLRTVIREASQNLGVYATVVRPGTIAVGDCLRVLDD
jgi:MOSC domain-containing protein YiiM